MTMIGRTGRRGLLALILGLAACTGDAPEQQVRKRFDDMQAAVEAGQAGDFIEGVSRDFTGGGGMDRAALHNIIRARTLANARIGATTGSLDVKVDGGNATVAFNVLLTASGGRLLPEQESTYRVTTAWRLEDDEWRVYHARWDGAQ